MPSHSQESMKLSVQGPFGPQEKEYPPNKTLTEEEGNPGFPHIFSFSHFYLDSLLRPIVDECRSLLKKFEQTRINHIFRAANSSADVLARAGCYQLVDFVVYLTLSHVLEALKFYLSVVIVF